MALSDTLGKLNQQHADRVQWEQQKPVFIKEWTDAVAALFADIKEYLQEFEAAGHLKLFLQNKPMSEERLGSYVALEMKIEVGSIAVTLSPVGRAMIGSLGAVALHKGTSPHSASEVTFLRVHTSPTDETLVWGQYVDAPAASPFLPRHSTQNRPQKTFQRLTKETFQEALDSILR